MLDGCLLGLLTRLVLLTFQRIAIRVGRARLHVDVQILLRSSARTSLKDSIVLRLVVLVALQRRVRRDVLTCTDSSVGGHSSRLLLAVRALRTAHRHGSACSRPMLLPPRATCVANCVVAGALVWRSKSLAALGTLRHLKLSPARHSSILTCPNAWFKTSHCARDSWHIDRAHIISLAPLHRRLIDTHDIILTAAQAHVRRVVLMVEGRGLPVLIWLLKARVHQIMAN